ncbi:PREDICTED: armadillo repeat-containing protein 7-like [Ceratosolen solmsi marchali]|uniref:Armadillo repeat-containing protein 7-like n=1 Tax=Ceratosolen solmsi marchali TaxID=326594 RepID=A0AAJ6YRF1_9HYME|nr:PREDICTED: armadillo repeat-containing protein 7-like [Ceratosolen solmsi marchali]XP_011502864.1 PREDICTED: armadillo repeat-containing protein 7-like [Ceratosolen solmsi marchali]XP_011502865.1 PREDICTED: armadillo repeat-containing protein 7-like [Ceratosolen solmsi marchali]
MFSTKKQLIKKTGKHGVGRFNFLQQLVTEYNVTKSRDAKEQVIANLANFAYDPINYDYLWRLKVIDLFFSALEHKNKNIVSFAIGGICNICLNPLHKQYILRNNGIEIISSLLTRSEESIILSSITTLMYLNTPDTKNIIASRTNTERMLEFSKSTNSRIKNLADIFLQDLCGIKQNKQSTSTITSDTEPSTSNCTNTDINQITIEDTSNTQSEDKQTNIETNEIAHASTSTITF